MESTSLLSKSPIGRHQSVRRVTIEPVIFLYYLYFSGSMSLVSQFVHRQLERRETGKQVQADASMWLMYMNIAATIPSFFSTVLLGGYSDHVGRKVAIVSPLIGAGVRLMIFIVTFAFDLPFSLLIVSSLLDGIGGGTSTILMACYSYISDITDTQSRSLRVVALEVCSGVALVISVLGTGYCIEYLGFLWTFVVLLTIVLLALIYVVFLLPETYQPTVEDDEVNLFMVKHFTRMLIVFAKEGDDRVTKRHWKLRFSLAMIFLVSGIQLARSDVQTLFLLAPPLSLNSVWIGYFYASAYVIMNVSIMITTRLVAKRTGDLNLVVVGLLSGMGYMLMFGLATNRVVLFLSPVVGCLSIFPIVLIRAFSSKIVHPSALGSMFAAIAWFQAVGILIGNVIQNAVMAATAGSMEGAVFFLDAGLYAATAVLVICFIVWLRRVRPTTDDHLSSEHS